MVFATVWRRSDDGQQTYVIRDPANKTNSLHDGWALPVETNLPQCIATIIMTVVSWWRIFSSFFFLKIDMEIYLVDNQRSTLK
jgi:hypothetical protein